MSDPYQRRNLDLCPPYRRKKPYSPYAKNRAKRIEGQRAEREAKEAINRKVEASRTGQLGIFLDDEREWPEGWLLARTPAEFFNLLHSIDTSRLTHLALDWHLGAGKPTGEEVVSRLVNPESDHLALLSNIRVIHCHSSDRDRAASMGRTLRAALPGVRIVMRQPGVLHSVEEDS